VLLLSRGARWREKRERSPLAPGCKTRDLTPLLHTGGCEIAAAAFLVQSLSHASSSFGCSKCRLLICQLCCWLKHSAITASTCLVFQLAIHDLADATLSATACDVGGRSQICSCTWLAAADTPAWCKAVWRCCWCSKPAPCSRRRKRESERRTSYRPTPHAQWCHQALTITPSSTC
jgi:hypothetical protein